MYQKKEKGEKLTVKTPPPPLTPTTSLPPLPVDSAGAEAIPASPCPLPFPHPSLHSLTCALASPSSLLSTAYSRSNSLSSRSFSPLNNTTLCINGSSTASKLAIPSTIFSKSSSTAYPPPAVSDFLVLPEEEAGRVAGGKGIPLARRERKPEAKVRRTVWAWAWRAVWAGRRWRTGREASARRAEIVGRVVAGRGCHLEVIVARGMWWVWVARWR